jgi:transposase
MGRPLDTDPRRRAVSAIEGGMSTGAAAERFSVSKAAAGGRARLKRSRGDVLPEPQGSGCGSVLDPYADFIDGLTAPDKDITPAEIEQRLGETHGLHVAPSTIWFFLDRRGRPGLATHWISIPSVWFLSTRQGPQRKWRARAAARLAANAAGRPCHTGTEYDHFHRRPDGADDAGRTDDGRGFPRLCRAGSRAHVRPGRHRGDG